MENKLKVLSAYLPYALILNDTNTNEIWELHYDSISAVRNWDKPYLFPLEDLTKPITLYGKTFKVEDEIFAMCNCGLSSNAKKYWKENFIENIKNTPYTQLSYEVVQKLLEWKFNIFNLPEDEYVKVTDDFNPYK